MKILTAHSPTPEQLKILLHSRPGVMLIKGAAGSGKTTTAILRLRQLTEFWTSRRLRLGLTAPVRVLVLTYNRTLQTYIQELAHEQVAPRAGLDLTVATFGKWARGLTTDDRRLLDPDQVRRRLMSRASALPGDAAFLVEEAQYVMDRFLPEDLDLYLTAKRSGRGTSPRMEAGTRARLLEEVIRPYRADMGANDLIDWNDVALDLLNVSPVNRTWDVIVVDEAQDFSANQARATHRHLSDPGSLTFVMDAVQRIYPRSFTWKEAGIDIGTTHTLTENYRNTRQIAAFARSLVQGLPIDDDGSLPDFSACHRDGPRPVVIYGNYSDQIEAMLARLARTADLRNESVAFLQPRGGAWFNYLRRKLDQVGIPWADLTRASEWPAGSENVAISTLYSAKGLEFDHVILPGLNSEVTPHGPDTDDTQLDNLRRLVAMGVGRARKTVMIGAKTTDPSTVLSLADPTTYDQEYV